MWQQNEEAWRSWEIKKDSYEKGGSGVFEPALDIKILIYSLHPYKAIVLILKPGFSSLPLKIRLSRRIVLGWELSLLWLLILESLGGGSSKFEEFTLHKLDNVLNVLMSFHHLLMVTLDLTGGPTDDWAWQKREDLVLLPQFVGIEDRQVLNQKIGVLDVFLSGPLKAIFVSEIQAARIRGRRLQAEILHLLSDASCVWSVLFHCLQSFVIKILLLALKLKIVLILATPPG